LKTQCCYLIYCSPNTILTADRQRLKNVNASVNNVQVVAVDRPGGAAIMNIDKTF
jgi:hypothetical protein